MSRYNFQSTGAAVGNAIQQFLMQRALEERQRMLDEAMRRDKDQASERANREMSLREQDAIARENEDKRRMAIDDEERRLAAAERAKAASAEANQAGVRGMIADRMNMGPIDQSTAQQIEGMGYREGVQVPGIITRASQPPNRTTVTVPGPNGRPMRKAVTDADLITGVEEYREPKAPSQASQGTERVLVSADGKSQRVARGAGEVNALLSQGWKLFDQVAARTSNTVDPNEAKQTTSTALSLAKRLKTHPGFDWAYGMISSRTSGLSQDATDAMAIRDQLVASLTLPNLGALKGPMSDKDIMFVKQLATRLGNPRISEAEARRAVDEAVLFLESKMGGAGGAGDETDALLDELLGGR